MGEIARIYQMRQARTLFLVFIMGKQTKDKYDIYLITLSHRIRRSAPAVGVSRVLSPRKDTHDIYLTRFI